MNVSRFLICLVLAVLPFPAVAQGFAGLATPSDAFARPQKDTVLTFPKDHGPHPDFRIEWWYLTATLEGADGTEYGVQWTLFRSALAPGGVSGWKSSQIWLGHAALTTPREHFMAERIARGGIGQAGVTASPFLAHIDDWEMAATPGTGIDQLRLTARGAAFRYDLRLQATGPIILHGDNGYSVKSDSGTASHYYSQPFYDVTGVLSLPDKDVAVTGHGWMDREWSSQPLSDDQRGWDWFSLSFDDGAKLMAFQLRDDKGGFNSGTWIGKDGKPTPLTRDDLRLEPLEPARVAGRDIPVTWRVLVPARDVDVTVSALNPDSWMATRFSYWEGPVRISGSRTGRGYLEMTGYE